MKILFVSTVGSINDFMLALTEMGHDVSYIPSLALDPVSNNEAHMQTLISAIEQVRPQYVFSYMFIPILSEITHSYGIPYVSWTYDSPLTSLFTPEIENDNNYVFIFDKAEYLRVKAMTKTNTNIFYLPLGAYLSRIGTVEITDNDIKKYSSDISFVGTLYHNNPYNIYSHNLTKNTGYEINNYLLANAYSWNKTKEWPSLSDNTVTEIKHILQDLIYNPTTLQDSLYFGLVFLPKKLAEIDRITILNELAKYYNVDLYTNESDYSALMNVHCHGRVNYEDEMTKVFYSSKINLNITLPSIETGVPQRIYDILASGGFCISNYQEEINELFDIGKNIETFRSIEELLEKSKYYLTHEKERMQIAVNGYLHVSEHHTLQHRIHSMFNLINKPH